MDGTAIAKKSTLASSGVPPSFGRWRLPASEHAGEQHRELRVGAVPELEVEIVDAEDRQREGVRRIERHAHRHRACRAGRALADDPGVALLDVVAQPAIGLAIHDAVAAARLDARLGEALVVDPEVAERHPLLDQQVAPGDQHDLPGVEPVNRKIGRLPIEATGA